MLKLFSRSEEIEAVDAIVTRVEPHIRIINGTLDEDPASPSSVVLNGRIDPVTLRFLKVDKEYQRPLGERAEIFEALKQGKIVPNIEIGVRGQDYDVEDGEVIIRSPAYIIDGWQRVGNAIRLLDLIPNHPLRIFASIHFNTDQIWERHRFTALNKNTKKVSPNLHLRNMRDKSPAVLTLFGLSNNTKDFALYNRVCWSQSMQRGHLIPATMLARTAMYLHAHKAGISGNTTEHIASSLDKAAAAVSLQNFRRNVATYFDLLNQCWPFAAIEYRNAAPQIKAAFLAVLARMLSRHPDFWDRDDTVLFIDADDRRKFAKFPINDPQISALAAGSGKSQILLYQLLVDHMNSGRRTNRLNAR